MGKVSKSGRKVIVLGSFDDAHAAWVHGQLAGRGNHAIMLDSRRFPGEIDIVLRDSWDWSLFIDGKLAVDSSVPCALFWRAYNGVRKSGDYVTDRNNAVLFESWLMMLSPCENVLTVNGWAAYTAHQHKPEQFLNAKRWISCNLDSELRFPDTQHYSSAPESVNHPSVKKPVQGGAGVRNILQNEILSFQRSTTVQTYMDGINVRVFVVGEEFFCYAVESDRVDYREDPGAVIRVADVPERILQDCLVICGLFEMEYAALDLIYMDGRYWFLEVNPAPMWLGFEHGVIGSGTGSIGDSICDLLIG